MKVYGDETYIGDGTAALPGYSFLLDPNTGIYRPAADELAFATNGVRRWSVDAQGNLIPDGTSNYDIGSVGDTVKDIYMDGEMVGSAVQAQSWAPALTALTTNPTLGVGGSTNGRYWHFGEIALFWGLIKFGTSGTNAGSGQYRVSLPFIADGFHDTRAPLGNLHIQIAGVNNIGTLNWTTTTTANLRIGGSSTALSHTAGWTANDEIFYQGSMVVA